MPASLLFQQDVESLETKLLGYDYAYLRESYYSCILNDIISGRISAFNSIVLNEYGLFETLEEMKKFVEERDRLKNEFNFEGGEFGIYRISEVTVV